MMVIAEESETSLPVDPAVAPILDVDRLPAFLAVPLGQYEAERENPVLKLWSMCETVELLLRFFFSAGYAELHRRKAWDQIRDCTTEVDKKRNLAIKGFFEKRIIPDLPMPLFEKWRNLVVGLASFFPGAGGSQENPLWGKMFGFIPGISRIMVSVARGKAKKDRAQSRPLEERDSLEKLRNQLAHGSIPRENARTLLEEWQKEFRELLAPQTWLYDIVLVCRAGGRYLHLRGASPEFSEYHPSGESERGNLEALAGNSEAVALVVGGQVLDLWPMFTFGMPRGMHPEKTGTIPVLQVYSRQGPWLLEYTPLGSPEVAHAIGTPEGLDAFRRLFRWGEYSGLGNLREPLANCIGRRNEIERLLNLLKSSREGVFWLSGNAGIGKTTLIGHLSRHFAEHPLPQTLVLPYYFKSHSDSCSTPQFLAYAVRSVAAFLNQEVLHPGASEGELKLKLKKLLSEIQEERVIFLVDGVDEICQSDSSFPQEIPLEMNFPGVVWFCAGREYERLKQIFSRSPCRRLYEKGLPALANEDIREIILENIGFIRHKILSQDRDSDGKVENAFIEKVAHLAGGLPLFVNCVVQDIKSERRFSVFDESERIPASLEDYYQELLDTTNVGTVHQILTPVVCALGLAREPLSLGAISDILVFQGLLVASDQPLESVREVVEGPIGFFQGTDHPGLPPVTDPGTGPAGENVGYSLFHPAFGETLWRQESTRGYMELALEAFGEMALSEDFRVSPGGDYFARWGIFHLTQGQRWYELEQLLSNPQVCGHVDDLALAASLEEIGRALLPPGVPGIVGPGLGKPVSDPEGMRRIRVLFQEIQRGRKSPGIP